MTQLKTVAPRSGPLLAHRGQMPPWPCLRPRCTKNSKANCSPILNFLDAAPGASGIQRNSVAMTLSRCRKCKKCKVQRMQRRCRSRGLSFWIKIYFNGMLLLSKCEKLSGVPAGTFTADFSPNFARQECSRHHPPMPPTPHAFHRHTRGADMYLRCRIWRPETWLSTASVTSKGAPS